MNDLIDRRTLIKDLVSDCLKAKEETKYPSIKEIYKRIEELIDKQKQIEAKPVVYGEWDKYRISKLFKYTCSICHCDTEEKTSFCPNCGADMRGLKNV